MRNIILSALVLLGSGLMSVSFAVDHEQFPLRAEYTQVSFISHEDLHAQLNDVFVVDVRSSYEFETLRISNAINVPVTNKGFVSEVQKLRGQSSKPIVFYCNGITCAKSYKACKISIDNGIPNTHAFDLGIFGWAQAYPNETALLGVSPVPQDRLLGKEQLEAHMLSPEEFAAGITDRSLVLDIREPFQRQSRILKDVTRSTPLDRIDYALEVAARDNKALFIYDAVGRQVRWLQYTLEDKNLSEYYFLKGGVKAYVDAGLE